jgi:hypothetical protein
MIKQKISKNQLQAELNRYLHELIGDQRISFGGIHRLAELDNEGSNWSKSITMKGSSVELTLNSDVISKVLFEISEKFNLEEE